MEVKGAWLFVIIEIFIVQVYSKEVKSLYTNGHYYSQYFPLEENMGGERTIRFSVRALRDAHILLAPSHQADGPVYEIVLGARNNTVNYIRGRCPCQEEPSATIRTVNLLSPREFRNFWVRIKADGHRTFVQVGLGGENTYIHQWRDPRPLNPQYLSFRSATTAEWRYGFSDDQYDKAVSPDRRQTIVTWTGFGQYFPLSDIVSHSDDGITVFFTVRTAKEFQVLLSPAVSSLGDVYELGITEIGAYVRRRHLGENKAALKEDGFLNDRERLGYWIKLTKDGVITMGKGGSSNTLLQWRDPSPVAAQFVSFTLHRGRGQDPDSSSYADVQYGLGPDYTLNSQDCTARWKDSTGQLPTGAVRGGRNNQDELYVCRATHEGQIIPGSYVPDKDRKGECHVTNSYSVHRKLEFQVLTGCRFTWVATSLGKVPEGSVLAGGTTGKQKLYVARIKHEGQVIIGKLQPDVRLAYIPFSGQELPFTNYEVLVQEFTSQSTPSATESSILPPLIG